MKEFETSFTNILKGLSNNINVQYPAKIIKVNNQFSVNIEYYDNGVVSQLANVPVKYYKTNAAYFYLKLSVGDKGVVRFFDTDIDLYRSKGVIAESDEEKIHDINDNLFELGFYPDIENYTFPDGDLVIGTVSGAVITLNGDGINITGGNVTLSGNVTIDGKNFLQHVHSNGNQGANTGAVV